MPQVPLSGAPLLNKRYCLQHKVDLSAAFGGHFLASEREVRGHGFCFPNEFGGRYMKVGPTWTTWPAAVFLSDSLHAGAAV
eukprot:4618808-Amphidinium_carterae.1